MDPLQGEVETFPDNMDVAVSQGGGGGGGEGGVLFRQWIKLQTCSDVWSTQIKTWSDVEIKQISSAINTRKTFRFQ